MTDSILSTVTGGRPGAPDLDLGRALTSTVRHLRRHGHALLLLAVLLLGGPALAEALWGSGESGSPVLRLLRSLSVEILADVVLTATATALALGGPDRRTLLRRLPAVLAVGGAAALVQTLGYLLLVVPGVILQCMWLVAVPVCVAERPSFAALDRSAALTDGRRWPVFALLAVYLVGGLLFTAGLDLVGSALPLPSAQAEIAEEAVVDILLSVVAAAGIAAVYLELRGEGAVAAEVAAVFD